MSIAIKLAFLVLFVLNLEGNTNALKCYKGFEPTQNQTSNFGLIEECEANPNLDKRGVKVSCYTRIISESGDNKIMRGCANDLQTCHTDILCWFCEKNLCNTVGEGNNITQEPLTVLLLTFFPIILSKFLSFY